MTALCETDRLAFHRFVDEDLDALHSVLGNAEAMRFPVLKYAIKRDVRPESRHG